MERILLITDDNGMTCVIATLVSDYIIDAIAQDICGFTFAFIAPLGTKQNNRWHLAAFRRNLSYVNLRWFSGRLTPNTFTYCAVGKITGKAR